MTAEASGYPTVQWSQGDITNAGFDHIDRFGRGTSSGLVVFFFDASHYMGGVYAKNITGVINPANQVSCVSVQPVAANSILDSLYLENINCNANWSLRIASGVGNFTVNSLDVHGITCNQLNTDGGDLGQTCVELGNPGTINRLTLDGLNVNNSLNAATNSYVFVGGSIKTVNIMNTTLNTVGSPAPSRLVGQLASSIIQQLNITNLYAPAGDAVFVNASGIASAPTITIRDSNIGTNALLSLNSPANVILDGNILSDSTAVVSVTGSIAVNVYARNNRQSGSGAWAAVNSGTPTFTWYNQGGNSPGISLTGVTGATFGAETACLAGPMPSTISGFGTGATLSPTGNACTFYVIVGTGASNNSGILTFPAYAPNNWNCSAQFYGDGGGGTAATGVIMEQSHDHFTVTMNAFSMSGAGLNFPQGSIILFSCAPSP